jgi:hypothetical protein
MHHNIITTRKTMKSSFSEMKGILIYLYPSSFAVLSTSILKWIKTPLHLDSSFVYFYWYDNKTNIIIIIIVTRMMCRDHVGDREAVERMISQKFWKKTYILISFDTTRTAYKTKIKVTRIYKHVDRHIDSKMIS